MTMTTMCSHPRLEEKFVDTVGMVTINASKTDAGRRIECRAINDFMEQPYRTFATIDVQCTSPTSYPPFPWTHHLSRHTLGAVETTNSYKTIKQHQQLELTNSDCNSYKRPRGQLKMFLNDWVELSA